MRTLDRITYRLSLTREFSQQRCSPLLTNLQQPMPNSTNPIKMERLHQISKGDTTLELELLQIFIEEIEINLEQLKLALSAKEPLEAIAKAHAIKGASANMGVPLMQSAATQIEFQVRSLQETSNLIPQSWEGLGDLVAQLEQTLAAVKTLTLNYQTG